MPTIFRFLVSLVLIAAVFAAIVYALGNFVSPNNRQMTIRLPPGRLDPRPIARPPPAVVEAPAGEESTDGGDGTTE